MPRHFRFPSPFVPSSDTSVPPGPYNPASSARPPRGALKETGRKSIPKSQIKGKYFSVVIENADRARQVITAINAAGGFVRRNYTLRIVRYIVIDLPESVSVIDVPFDEPRNALSGANMVRSYGNMRVDNRMIKPKQEMPSVVPAYWITAAAQGRTEIPWSEGRYVKTPSRYLERLRTKQEAQRTMTRFDE